MSKAEQSGEDQHLAMLAYRVTPRGPEKLRPADAMTECKFRALLPIKQHLSAQLNTSRDHGQPKTATGRALQQHSIITPSNLTIQASLSTMRPQASNLEESNTHWDKHRESP